MLKYTWILLFTFALTSGQAQDEKWSLRQCIDYALENNIQIQQSALNYELAEIDKTQNVAGAFPSINASGSHGYNWGQTIDPFTNQFATDRIRSNNFNARTSLTIFNGFQRLNSIKQANIDMDARNADLQKMKNDISLNVANAYLNILFNMEFLAVAEYNLENTSAQLERTRKLVNAGSLPEGDLLQLEAQQATDSASLITSQNNLRLSYLNLAQLLQLEPEESRNFEIERPDENLAEETEVTADLETVLSKAVNTLPEVKGAQANLVSAETGLSISQGQMSPNLSVSYSIGSGYSGANNVPIGDPVNLGQVPIGVVQGTGSTVLSIDEQTTYEEFDTKPFNDQISDNFNQSLFFSLSIPIFNGLSTHSNIQRSQINVQNAKLQLELTKNQLKQNVQSDYFDMLAAMENYRAAQQSVNAQQKAFDYASVRYEAGVINTVEYTNARILLDNARADLIRNKFDFIFKAKVIDFYTGKPIVLN